MVVAGLGLVTALSFVPYTLNLFSRAERAFATTAHATEAGPAMGAVLKRRAAPTFDAAEWYAARNEEPEKHGVLIEALDQTSVFASHNADTGFNPASLIKLSTSLAVLKKLGADYRFKTRVAATGAVDRTGTLHGTLYFSGDDPTFGDFAASLIANELRARGIKRVTQGIAVSPAFSFNFSDSAEESGARLVKALRLGNVPVAVWTEPAGAHLFTCSTYSLRDVLLYMNAHSNNFIADRLGALVGGADGVRQFLIDDLGLPAHEVVIERPSGLGFNRMTPRGIIAVLRGLIAETGRQHIEPEDIMPVASDDVGTLRHRFSGTGLQGLVVGKTGTLTHIDGGAACLAGFVRRQSDTVLFAILDQGTRVAENRQLEDQLLCAALNISEAAGPRAASRPRTLLSAASIRIEETTGE